MALALDELGECGQALLEAVRPRRLRLGRGRSPRRGTVTEVPEDVALLVAFAGAAGAHGHTAVVGMPALGLLAAVQAGLDPARILLVDHPGRHWQAVVAELARAVDVVMVDPSGPVSHVGYLVSGSTLMGS